MTGRNLNIGLIGPGSFADGYLLPGLSLVKGAALWSVMGRDEARTLEFAKKNKAAAEKPAYTDVAAFLADPKLDAVIITSPDRLHRQHAVAAAEAGKHVFLEKPMATTLPDAEAISAACKSAGVKLALGYHLRWHAGHRKVSELLNAGELGDLRHMRLEWTFTAEPANWRVSAETGRWWTLAAVGTHGIDQALWLLGPTCGKVVSAHGVTTNPMLKKNDEHSVVTLKFENGAIAEIVSSVLYRSPRVIDIYGSKGAVRCLDTLGPRGTGTISWKGDPLAFEPVNPYAQELQNFADAIAGGAKICADGDVGIANIRLLEQVSPQPQS